MKTTRITFNGLLILSFLFCLVGCAQDDLGEVVVKEESNLPFFDKINVNSFGKVSLNVGNEQSIKIETHEDIINDISYEVIDEELVIDFRNNRKNLNVKKLNITVSSESFQKISLNDVAEIAVNGIIETPRLEINQKDVGSISVDEIRVDDLILNLEDVGNISIKKGTATNGDLNQDGVGNIQTFGVTYEECIARLNDVGNIEVTVVSVLNARIRGVGNILYKGNPEVIKRENDTGKVIQK